MRENLVRAAWELLAPKIGQATFVLDGVELPVRANIGIHTQPISFIGLPVVAVPIPLVPMPIRLKPILLIKLPPLAIVSVPFPPLPTMSSLLHVQVEPRPVIVTAPLAPGKVPIALPEPALLVHRRRPPR